MIERNVFSCYLLLSIRFISSLDAAEALKDTRQYIKAARSMGAVMQLSRYFDKYKDIETVWMDLFLDCRLVFSCNVFRSFEMLSALQSLVTLSRWRIWSIHSMEALRRPSQRICWTHWRMRRMVSMISW